MNVSYGDAEVRGRMRLWKNGLGKRYARFNDLCVSRKLSADIKGFAMRKSLKGRDRALSRLREQIEACGATLEGARVDGNYPVAIWAILKPRRSVRVDTSDPSYTQECIALNYLLISRDSTGYGFDEGLWTLEIPDHALGRLMHRSKEPPTRAIYTAHRAALLLSLDDIAPRGRVDHDHRFLLPTRDGCFIAGLFGGIDTASEGSFTAHIRADTWLATDMLHPDQVPACRGMTGLRLGESLLLPSPMRTMTAGEEYGAIAVALTEVRMPVLREK